MKFGSLFTGIGGIDLGFERAGMKCAWQVEIDDYCNRVLEKHWPNVERFRDVREVGKHNLAPVDLIAGGFPCQPHSVAGKRRGKEDDRNLWPDYLRIIQELKPRWVVGENVPGIITTMLDDVLADLEGAGYTVGTFNIPASAFGANHRRYRIFVVAHASQQYRTVKRQKALKFGRGSEIVADTDGVQGGLSGEPREDQAEAGASGEALSNAISRRRQSSNKEERSLPILDQNHYADLSVNWSAEPDVGRVANGVPHRVDRLRALGNAVVPQVAEFIGRSIVEVEQMIQKGSQ